MGNKILIKNSYNHSESTKIVQLVLKSVQNVMPLKVTKKRTKYGQIVHVGSSVIHASIAKSW